MTSFEKFNSRHNHAKTTKGDGKNQTFSTSVVNAAKTMTEGQDLKQIVADKVK